MPTAYDRFLDRRTGLSALHVANIGFSNDFAIHDSVKAKPQPVKADD